MTIVKQTVLENHVHGFPYSVKKVSDPTLKLDNEEYPNLLSWIFLSFTLKWDKHIGHVSLKVSRVIDVLLRLKYIYLQEVLLTLYRAAIFKLIIDYIYLKKTVIIITNKDYVAHTNTNTNTNNFFWINKYE